MTDYLLDDDNDLSIADGDFVIGDSDLQHQKLLLFAEKGAYKQYPTIGVAAATYLKDDNSADLLREIRLQFGQDGMQVNQVAINAGKLQIDAQYVS